MPRMMSRNPMLYRRRSSLGSRSAKSSAASMSNDSDSTLDHAFRWLSLSKHTSPGTSLASSARSSPSLSPAFGRPVPSARRPAAGNASAPLVVDVDEDVWGQFVDTAEAEQEFIRHSKILSKRYSIN